MSVLEGLTVLGTYTGPVSDQVDSLLDLIPNPDASHGTGAIAGGGFLDEMSAPAAAQLRKELIALGAANVVAYGQYTVTADDATANLANITTGLADLTLADCAVTVRRAGTNVTVDAALSEPSAGVLRVADGSTYNTTAGDIITWFAK